MYLCVIVLKSSQVYFKLTQLIGTWNFSQTFFEKNQNKKFNN